jgi:beta-lactamase regulating signal transducer with metallopeptidase domain
MWITGQIDATLMAASLLLVAHWGRHRLSPSLRSAILLIALVRLALPPFIQSPWSEAASDLPPVDEARIAVFGWLQDDRVQYLFALWIAISVVLIARLAWQLSYGRRSVLATSERAPEWLQMRARNLSTGATPEVRVSDRGDGPFATGLVHRLIVLPASLVDRLDEDALDAALAHEIAHHERRDLWWLAAARLLGAIAWLNPLALVLSRSIGMAREDGSDDWAVSRTSHDPFAYVEALLKSARAASAEGQLLTLGAHPMHGRFRRLLDGRCTRDRRLGVVGVVVIIMLAAMALPGAHTPRVDDGERVVIVIKK